MEHPRDNHQPVRLKIMATLKALPPEDKLEFVRLKVIVEATEGNLGAHITTLEEAGYICVEKDFDSKKPRTRVALSKQGRKAFEAYVAYLRDIIDGSSVMRLRRSFLLRLQNELSALPQTQIDDIIADFDRHFIDGLAAGRNEYAIAAALGDPSELAIQFRDCPGLVR